MSTTDTTLLAQVGKPGRYLGLEPGAARKDWQEARCRIALVFPDLYEIGMSHQGLKILYHEVNRRHGLLAERVYAPDRDLEELLRRRGEPLTSLESRRPLAEFDVLGVTLPYELCATNMLTVLDLAGIPFYAADRPHDAPVVLGGGPGAFQPEPFALFFDALLLGDGEEAIIEILETVATARAAGVARQEILERLAAVQGVYVPLLHPGGGSGPRVRRRVLPELPAASEPPIVPLVRIVHDRLGIEVARGCTRGCRFCQAGIIYRPVRERRPADILASARQGLAAGGFDEVALLSLSTGDYSCLGPLLHCLMQECAPKRISVSLPSMRVGTLTPQVMAEIRRVRKTGFTLAPEAGSERMRRVINKGITEEDLLAACREAVRLGWRRIKLYFMFGLPEEEEADIDAIADLARRVHRETGCRVTVSAATFVPKAHTPFQWERQLSIDEGWAAIDRLKRRLAGRALGFRWHDPRQSFLEGVFSRGDRRLAPVVAAAWRLGARLDGWSEHFDLEIWRRAAAEHGVDLASYLRARDLDERLPWDHLDPGVSRDFLVAERRAASAGRRTEDCRAHGCQGCGLCDFKEVRPRIWDQEAQSLASGCAGRRTGGESGKGGPAVFRYRLDYRKVGEVRFLSHLEVIGLFYRALRVAGLPLAYSQGHNPTPRVAFGPALSLGVESEAEYLVLTCERPIDDPAAACAAMNRFLPPGLQVARLVRDGDPGAGPLEVAYRVVAPVSLDAARVAAFLAADRWELELVRKKGVRRLDVRPLVRELGLQDANVLTLVLVAGGNRPAVKPAELVAAVFALGEEAAANLQIRKLWWRASTAASGRLRDQSSKELL